VILELKVFIQYYGNLVDVTLLQSVSGRVSTGKFMNKNHKYHLLKKLFSVVIR
jgi:hypothetical protein